ncbi:MAG: M23 family metallopeptidase [Fusobacteriaceae bacterium]|jgi:murein DD-endopeptidase MepM/ murein hydrolase activator NlpD|nr:M23 family metallopeptidase [Fusobacteriaceae bacterium]MBP9596826.1 M23 family metallopeptidase [Fusobacteriaceae bacterium]
MKKIYCLFILLALYSCTTTEYKGFSGTDQGIKNSKKISFDGTDYYKIYGEELPKTDKKSTNTTTKTTSTKTTTKTDTKSTTDTTYKIPSVNDTKDFLFPIKNPVVKKAYKEGSYSGIDFTVPKSSDVYAVAPGMVIFSGDKASLGNALFVYHNNGYVSIYTNLEKLNYKKGDYINSTKDIVAKATNSFGFEFRKRTDDGTVPLDPNKFLKKR